MKRPMASDPSVSVRPLWSRCVAQELRKEGVDVEAALAESGLNWRLLNKPDGWIPFGQHAELFEIAARELKNDCYGMTLAQRVDVRDGDILAYLGIASETVEAALRNMARYSMVFSEAFQVELEVHGSAGILNFRALHPSIFDYRQASEFRLAHIVSACRYFTGKLITPRSVEFIHQRGTGMSSFAEFFACPVKFGQSHERIIFSKTELATPTISVDHRLLAILHNHAEEILRRRPQPRHALILKLERRLIELIPTGEARAKIVAAELGMSERTLVRRLSELGTSFTDIVDHLRYDLAIKYLSQRDLSLTHIAFLVGYANPSAFSSACRRWTGKPPGKLRASLGCAESGAEEVDTIQ
jgi:AraC-like DNA-binding protein